MCSLIAILMLVLGGWFGFSTLTGFQTSSALPSTEAQSETTIVPTQAFSCAAPSQEVDIANMLAIVGKAFNTSTWTQQISSESSMNTATWIANSLGAVAYLEYLH